MARRSRRDRGREERGRAYRIWRRLLDRHRRARLLELTNVNFMNKLRQGAIRVRASQRQELVR